MNRSFAVGFLVGLIFISAAGPAVALAQIDPTGQVLGRPSISVSAVQQTVSSGTETEVQFTLTNRGRIDKGGPDEYETRVTTARALTVEFADEETPIEIDAGTISVGNVETGTTQTPPITVTIPEGIPPGDYEIPLEYEYTYTRVASYNTENVEYNDFTERASAGVEITVREEAQFEVTRQNAVGQIGDDRTIQLTLMNTGTRTAFDASVTATSKSDELTFGSDSESSTAYAGQEWKPGERRTITYRTHIADTAALRNYTLDLDVGYTDRNGIEQTTTALSAGVATMPEQTFAVNSVDTALRVGTEGTLTAIIENTGPQPVFNPVSVISVNNQNIDITTSEYALSTLRPGDTAQVQYNIDISEAATATPQQFSLTVQYSTERGSRRTSDALQTTAAIREQRDRFIIQAAAETVTAGGQTEFKLQVTNNGEQPLESIEAKAFLDAPLASSNDEAFIAALDPGETTTIVIPLSADSGALESKTYPFAVDFQYDLPNGDTKVSKTYKVPVDIQQPTDQSGLSLPLSAPIIGGSILIIIGSAVWYRRR
jgi:hypothetical protein